MKYLQNIHRVYFLTHPVYHNTISLKVHLPSVLDFRDLPFYGEEELNRKTSTGYASFVFAFLIMSAGFIIVVMIDILLLPIMTNFTINKKTNNNRKYSSTNNKAQYSSLSCRFSQV